MGAFTLETDLRTLTTGVYVIFPHQFNHKCTQWMVRCSGNTVVMASEVHVQGGFVLVRISYWVRKMLLVRYKLLVSDTC